MKYKLYIDRAKINKEGLCPLFIVFFHEGQRFKIGLDISSINKPDEHLIFSKNEKGRNAKTTRLQKIFAALDKYIENNLYVDIPFETLKEHIVGIIRDRKTYTSLFADYVKLFAETKENKGTRGLYELTARKIERFDNSATFDTINVEWLQRFERTNKENGMSQNGISLHLRNIRTVFNWCIDNEKTTKYPFRRFQIKSETTFINNLTPEQIAIIRDYPVEEWLEQYRDLFMLTFYLCGINPVDLLSCRKLKNGRMQYKRQKTGKLLNIPVAPEAMAIINKYKGRNYLLSPLDNNSDYKTFCKHWNGALRKIGKVEFHPDKIGKLRKKEYISLFPDITIYSARYSFASIAAELDIPRETIALCLGHTWADVTSRYINYDNRKIDFAVRKVIDYINKIDGQKIIREQNL